LGENFICIAFEVAAAADLAVKLYFNAFNIETAGFEINFCAEHFQGVASIWDKYQWGTVPGPF
jgi:cytidine deaminase